MPASFQIKLPWSTHFRNKYPWSHSFDINPVEERDRQNGIQIHVFFFCRVFSIVFCVFSDRSTNGTSCDSLGGTMGEGCHGVSGGSDSADLGIDWKGSCWHMETLIILCILYYPRWWFQIFFIFTPTCGNDSIWLIFLKWVETTN